MSELTPCNYCSLTGIRRRAEKRGATVECRLLTPYEMKSTFGGNHSDYSSLPQRWWMVKESDAEKPCAYFLALTTECAC